jgi:hypothetical protein
MKKLNYAFISALLVKAFLFGSCTPEEGVVPLPDPIVTCKPSKSYNQAGKFYNTYEYNANGKLIKSSNYKMPDTLLSYTLLEYNAENKPVKSLYYNGRTQALTSTMDIEYGANGLWSRKTGRTPGVTGSGVSVAEYDANNNLVKVTWTTDVDLDGYVMQSRIYVNEYVNGNVSRRLIYFHGDGTADYPTTPSVVYTYEHYSDKEDKATAETEFSTVFNTYGVPPGKNLVKSVLEDDQANGFQYSSQYTYELNAEGYVTKRIAKNARTATDSFPATSSTETRIMEYICK